MSPEELGKNGQQFLDFSFPQWFAYCGELVFVEPGSKERGFGVAPEHQDGVASIMHLGVTLYGRRTLVCRQGFGQPDVFVRNVPGTVYVGQLTGPHHQVTHEAAEAINLLEVPGLGRCGLNVVARTALFGFDRARMRKTPPSPAPVFAALTRCFREVFAASPLRLPSLKECKSHIVTSQTES